MVTIIFAVLKKFWPAILVALAVAIVVYHYVGLHRTIAKQKIEIAELQQEVAQQKTTIEDLNGKLSDCAAANAQYQAALDKVNGMVENLQKVADQQQQMLGDLRVMIGKERGEKAKVIAELKDLKTKPLAKTCEGAIEELVDGTKNFTPLHPSQGAPVFGVPK